MTAQLRCLGNSGPPILRLFRSMILTSVQESVDGRKNRLQRELSGVAAKTLFRRASGLQFTTRTVPDTLCDRLSMFAGSKARPRSRTTVVQLAGFEVGLLRRETEQRDRARLPRQRAKTLQHSNPALLGIAASNGCCCSARGTENPAPATAVAPRMARRQRSARSIDNLRLAGAGRRSR